MKELYKKLEALNLRFDQMTAEIDDSVKRCSVSEIGGHFWFAAEVKRDEELRFFIIDRNRLDEFLNESDLKQLYELIHLTLEHN